MDNDYFDFIDDNIMMHSLASDQQNNQRIYCPPEKVNPKNTYIKKISNLVQTQNNQTHRSVPLETTFTPDSQDQPPQEQQGKLKNNRKSARESRKRKKLYIELLENKVKMLTEKAQQSERLSNQLNSAIQNMRQAASSAGNGDQQKILAFTNLENQTLTYAKENILDYQLSLIQNSFGPANENRLESIKHYFSEIIDNSLPIDTKYMMVRGGHGEPIKTEDPVFSLTQRQQEILKKQQNKLNEACGQFHDFYSELRDTQNRIENELITYDSTLSELKEVMKPLQMAKLMLYHNQIDNQGLYRASFEDNFEAKPNEQMFEPSLDIYQFVKEKQWLSGLTMKTTEIFDLYNQSEGLIRSRVKPLRNDQ